MVLFEVWYITFYISFLLLLFVLKATLIQVIGFFSFLQKFNIFSKIIMVIMVFVVADLYALGLERRRYKSIRRRFLLLNFH